LALYKAEYTSGAKRKKKKIAKQFQSQIEAEIGELEKDPRHVGVEKLTDEDGLYRARAGNFRIVYRVDDQKRKVIITNVGDRKKVYKK